MLTKKERRKEKVVISILTLLLLLLFLPKPLLAKKAQAKNNSSNRSKAQSVKTNSRRSVVRSRPSISNSKTRKPTMNITRRQNPRPKIIQKAAPRQNINRSSRQTVKTNSRRSIVRNQPSISNSKTRKSTTNITRQQNPRPKTIQKAAPQQNRQLQSTKRSRIVNPKPIPKSSATSTRKRLTRNSDVSISTSKTSRIATRITPSKRPTVSSGKKTQRKQLTINPVKTSRIVSPITERKPTVIKGKQNKTIELTEKNRISRNRPKQSIVNRTHKTSTFASVSKQLVKPSTEIPAIRNRKNNRQVKSRKFVRNTITTKTVLRNNQSSILVKNTARHGKRYRSGRASSIVYEDRPHIARPLHRHEHIYRNHHNRICHRIVWPRYSFRVRYAWGPRTVFRNVYPYHHRKYIFISLGGYWPVRYRYVRYYWYPSHFYYWYGYYPIARQVDGDTYNYYTYNYYYNDDTSVNEYSQTQNGLSPVDHTTFEDVREKLAQQQQEPQAETLADSYFEDAVKAFEEGNYIFAADRLAQAMELAPEDVILPFAYAQALFANDQYTEAANVIRNALENLSPEEQGVFYPRGLYPDEEVLLEQIDRLAEKAELYPYNSSLQLLLGYHLLGIGETQSAIEPLKKAGHEPENAVAATILLNLAEKITSDNQAKQ
ncbi:MAG: tetratricopeptide repeat protein [Planctomycetota bacterium]|jgi:hypothetical protein